MRALSKLLLALLSAGCLWLFAVVFFVRTRVILPKRDGRSGAGGHLGGYPSSSSSLSSSSSTTDHRVFGADPADAARLSYPPAVVGFLRWVERSGGTMQYLRVLQWPSANWPNGDSDDDSGDRDGYTADYNDPAAGAPGSSMKLFRGLAIESDTALAPGTPLLAIPKSALITVEMAQATPFGVEMVRSPFTFAPTHYLAAFLLQSTAHRRPDTTSAFAPYFRILPQEGSPWMRRFPLFWQDAELQELRGSHILDRVKIDKRHLQQAFRVIRSVAPDWCPSCTLEEWLHAHTVVRSRMQSIATGGGPGDLTSALVPLADLIPHGPRSTTKQQWAFGSAGPGDRLGEQDRTRTVRDTDMLVVTASRGVGPREQLRHCSTAGSFLYDHDEQLSNSAMLLVYGTTVMPTTRQVSGGNFRPKSDPLWAGEAGLDLDVDLVVTPYMIDTGTNRYQQGGGGVTDTSRSSAAATTTTTMRTAAQTRRSMLSSHQEEAYPRGDGGSSGDEEGDDEETEEDDLDDDDPAWIELALQMPHDSPHTERSMAQMRQLIHSQQEPEGDLDFTVPLSFENEAAVLLEMAKALRMQLHKYPGALEDDLQALRQLQKERKAHDDDPVVAVAAAGGLGSPRDASQLASWIRRDVKLANRWNALVVRAGEKLVSQHWIQVAAAVRPALMQGAGLTAALRAKKVVGALWQLHERVAESDSELHLQAYTASLLSSPLFENLHASEIFLSRPPRRRAM